MFLQIMSCLLRLASNVYVLLLMMFSQSGHVIPPRPAPASRYGANQSLFDPSKQPQFNFGLPPHNSGSCRWVGLFVELLYYTSRYSVCLCITGDYMYSSVMSLITLKFFISDSTSFRVFASSRQGNNSVSDRSAVGYVSSFNFIASA